MTRSPDFTRILVTCPSTCGLSVAECLDFRMARYSVELADLLRLRNHTLVPASPAAPHCPVRLRSISHCNQQISRSAKCRSRAGARENRASDHRHEAGGSQRFAFVGTYGALHVTTRSAFLNRSGADFLDGPLCRPASVHVGGIDFLAGQTQLQHFNTFRAGQTPFPATNA